jgi:hypothetical protein
MTTKSTLKRHHSAEAKERMSEAARKRHDANTVKIEERVRSAMNSVEAELAGKTGDTNVSPTLAEIARRAAIHEVTLHKPRYKTLLNEVKEWQRKLSQPKSESSETGKRSQKTRIAEWENLYDSLKDTHRLTETELLIVNEELKVALAENERLKQRVAELSKILNVNTH